MSDHTYRETLRAFVLDTLKNRASLPMKNWSVQGFGFMRYRVSPNVRLHIWDSRLRIPNVSDIHDHAQWSFTSRVMSGQIVNIRLEEGSGDRYLRGVIKCGVGGGKLPGLPEPCDLHPVQRPEIFGAGEHYHQEADEIHRTYAEDGTVTLITQERKDTDTARVYWPNGSEWVDAIPRPATAWEVQEIGARALAVFH